MSEVASATATAQMRLVEQYASDLLAFEGLARRSGVALPLVEPLAPSEFVVKDTTVSFQLRVGRRIGHGISVDARLGLPDALETRGDRALGTHGVGLRLAWLQRTESRRLGLEVDLTVEQHRTPHEGGLLHA